MTRSATRGQIKGLTAALRAIPSRQLFCALKGQLGRRSRGLVQGGRPGGGRWAGPCKRTERTWPVCGYSSRGGGTGGPADKVRTLVGCRPKGCRTLSTGRLADEKAAAPFRPALGREGAGLIPIIHRLSADLHTKLCTRAKKRHQGVCRGEQVIPLSKALGQ